MFYSKITSRYERSVGGLLALAITLASNSGCTPKETFQPGSLVPKPGVNHKLEVRLVPVVKDTEVDGDDLLVRLRPRRECRLLGPTVRRSTIEREANTDVVIYASLAGLASALIGVGSLASTCSNTLDDGKTKVPCTASEESDQRKTDTNVGAVFLTLGAALGGLALGTGLRGLDTTHEDEDEVSQTPWAPCTDDQGGPGGKPMPNQAVVVKDGDNRKVNVVTDERGLLRLSGQKMEWSEHALIKGEAEIILDGQTATVSLEQLRSRGGALRRQRAEEEQERAAAAARTAEKSEKELQKNECIDRCAKGFLNKAIAEGRGNERLDPEALLNMCRNQCSH